MYRNRHAVAKTWAGRLEGSCEEGLYIFKGVPYGAPPLGKLRWLPPQPVKPWQGIRQAKEYGTYAPQNLLEADIVGDRAYGQVQEEDCLFLNIWSPALDNKHRPVMVWIHGGGFQRGTGSQIIYDGSKLARRGNVVIVNINYRLGVLGFLRLNEVTGGKIPATGNEGLLDQIAALEWVRDNIEAFGGDPDNVTVFGESAGGISIGCLLAMPSARGLFRRAILSSGVGNVANTQDEAVHTAEQFIDILGGDTGDEKALRALTVEQLLSADTGLDERTTVVGGLRRLILAPVVDGKTLPELPIDAIKHGSAADIPLLVGTNLEECRLFTLRDSDFPMLDEAGLVNRCRFYVPEDHVCLFIETYRKARVQRGESASPADILVAIMTDSSFRIPAVRVVEAQRLHQQLVYSYILNWKTPVMEGALGACHALDIGLLFGTYNEKFHGSGPGVERVSQNIQEAWLAFGRNGDPSCESVGNWPAYGESRLTMMLSEKSYIEPAPYEEERRIWEMVP